MKRFYFNKLVRDKIIERNDINSDVVHTEYRTLNVLEYRQELAKKIAEELAEIPFGENEKNEAIKELGDLQTVVNALRDSLGVSTQEVDEAVKAKLDESGGFSRREYIEYIDLVDDSKWVKIFRSQPEKYKEESL